MAKFLPLALQNATYSRNEVELFDFVCSYDYASSDYCLSTEVGVIERNNVDPRKTRTNVVVLLVQLN